MKYVYLLIMFILIMVIVLMSCTTNISTAGKASTTPQVSGGDCVEQILAYQKQLNTYISCLDERILCLDTYTIPCATCFDGCDSRCSIFNPTCKLNCYADCSDEFECRECRECQAPTPPECMNQ